MSKNCRAEKIKKIIQETNLDYTNLVFSLRRVVFKNERIHWVAFCFSAFFLLIIFSPHLAYASFKDAYEAFQSRKYDVALSLAKQSSAPSLLEDYSLWMQGKSALELKDYPLAQSKLEALIKNHPQSLFWQDAVQALGQLFFLQQKFDKLTEYLTPQVERLDKNHKGLVYYYLGKAEETRQKTAEAKFYYKKAYIEFPQSISDIPEDLSLQLNDLSAQDYKTRGDAYFEAKNYFGAERAYQKSGLASAMTNRGRALLALKKYNEALPLLKADENALSSSEQAELCYRQATLNSNQTDVLALRSCISKGYKHDLRDKALWRLGWAAYENRQYDQAGGFFKDLQEGATDFPTQAKGAYWLGRSYEKRGDLKKAGETFETASSLAPFSYYSFMALKKIQKLNVFQTTPKVPATWTQGFPQWQKPVHKFIRIQKIEALYDLGLAKYFRDELQLGVEELKASPEMQREFLSTARESKAPFLRVFLAQRYWEPFKNIFASPRLAEDARNSLQFPYPYKKEIEKHAKVFGLEPQFVVGLMRQESAFQKWVTSSANAKGLMQLLPTTARARAKAAGFNLGDLFDPNDNIEVGCAELSYLLSRFSNNWIHAIAGYNAGPGRPPRWAAQFPGLDEDEFVEEIPFSETNLYVKLVMRNYWSYKTLY